MFSPIPKVKASLLRKTSKKAFSVSFMDGSMSMTVLGLRQLANYLDLCADDGTPVKITRLKGGD